MYTFHMMCTLYVVKCPRAKRNTGIYTCMQKWIGHDDSCLMREIIRRTCFHMYDTSEFMFMSEVLTQKELCCG